jgi:hypothetical protein
MAKKKIKAIRGQKSDLRANLLQVSEACPFHLANPGDCPLFPLRRMGPTKRLQWVNAMSESDLAYLATYHRVCFRIKVESGSAKERAKAPAKKKKRTRIRSVKLGPDCCLLSHSEWCLMSVNQDETACASRPMLLGSCPLFPIKKGLTR